MFSESFKFDDGRLDFGKMIEKEKKLVGKHQN